MNQLELKDIHLPDAVSWWPPAIGWWLALITLVLIVLALVLMVKIMLKKLNQVSVRKRALKVFFSIKSSYKEQHDKTQLSQQLSQLLRQILLTSQPRSDVASATGKQWLALLNRSHPKGHLELEWLQLLATSAYQKQADYDADELMGHIQQWLHTYPKRHVL